MGVLPVQVMDDTREVPYHMHERNDVNGLIQCIVTTEKADRKETWRIQMPFILQLTIEISFYSND